MWNLSFMAVIWSIWKERNGRCFEESSYNGNQLGKKVKHRVAMWASCLPYFKGISADSIIHNWKEVAFSCLLKHHISHRWIPPPVGVLKLNFDGSALGNLGLVGVGGVIRNDGGKILLSYYRPAGICSSNKAEILSLKIGLLQASRLILNG